jgi:hypothetical protein
MGINNPNNAYCSVKICRGSIAFGNACLNCQKCKDELFMAGRGGKPHMTKIMLEQNIKNNMENQEMTLGQKRVDFSFNPTQHTGVKETKEFYAAEIDRLEALRMTINDKSASPERQRSISRAQTMLEDACMIAVRLIFQ